MRISLIAAVAANGVIGRNNDMAWHLPDDFQFFKHTTLGHPIVMGRKTLDALGGKPLPKRPNIVVTRQPDYVAPDGVTVCKSLEEALDDARAMTDTEVFVIGGAEIYAQALPLADTLYLTEIHRAYDGDATFPDFSRDEWHEVNRRHHPADARHETAFDFVEYKRVAREQ